MIATCRWAWSGLGLALSACVRGPLPAADDPAWAMVEDEVTLKGLMTVGFVSKELRPERLFAAGDASCPGLAFPLGDAPTSFDVSCTSEVGMRYEGTAILEDQGLLATYDLAWEETPGSGAAALLPPQIPSGFARGVLDDGDRRDPPVGSTWVGDVGSSLLDALGVGDAADLRWSFHKEDLGDRERHSVDASASLVAGALTMDMRYLCPIEVRPGALCDEGSVRVQLGPAEVTADLAEVDPATGCVQAMSARGNEVTLCL